MNQDTLMIIMASAVTISALALLMQALLMIGVYRSAKVLQEQMAVLAPKAHSTLISAEQTLEESRKQIADMSKRVGEIVELTRTQLVRVDTVLADAAGRATVQMDRVELVLDDALGRVQETVNVLHTGIMRPLRQINAVNMALRAAIEHFMRGGRRSVAQVTQEDEMFI